MLNDLEKSLLSETYVDWEPINVLYKGKKEKGITFDFLAEALANLFNAGYIECKIEYIETVYRLTKEELLEHYGGDLTDEEIKIYPKVVSHTFKSTLKGDKLSNQLRIEDAEQDVERNPQDAESHYTLAYRLAHDNENRLECLLRAEKEYKNTIQLDSDFTIPAWGHPYTQLGILYEKLHEHYPECGITVRKVKAAYKRATVIASDYYMSWHEWGKYIERNNVSLEEIHNAYSKALERVPQGFPLLHIIENDLKRVQELISEKKKE